MARVCSYPSLILPWGFRGLVICSYASFWCFKGCQLVDKLSWHGCPCQFTVRVFWCQSLGLALCFTLGYQFFLFFFFLFLPNVSFPFAESCQKQEHAHHGSVKLGQRLDHPGDVLVPGPVSGQVLQHQQELQEEPQPVQPQCHSSNRWRVQYTDNTAGSPVVQSVYGDPGK